MKKTLMSLLLVSLSLTMFFGCAEEKKNETPNTPVNFSNPDTAIGTYNVDMFWVDAVITQLTNNCEEAKQFISAVDAAKGCGSDGNVVSSARATITKNSDGKYVVSSKMQMAGAAFDNATLVKALGALLTDNQYNYTLYTAIPSTAIVGSTMNTGTSQVIGTTGREASKLTSDPVATYDFVLRDDGRILSLMGKTNPIPMADALSVYLLLRKISDNPEVLNPNELFPTPKIANFKVTPDPLGPAIE